MSKTLGTLKSFLLQDVITAGFKPLVIALVDDEETFVFGTKEDAEEAEDYFMPEGTWLSQEEFDEVVTLSPSSVTKIPELLTLTGEELEERKEELEALAKKEREDALAKKLKSLASVVKKALAKLPPPPTIELAKSCDTCNSCPSYLKDAIRKCTVHDVHITGHSTCSSWTERVRKTKGGIRKFKEGAQWREKGSVYHELFATIKHLGVVEYKSDGRWIYKLSIVGGKILVQSKFNEAEMARYKASGSSSSLRYIRDYGTYGGESGSRKPATVSKSNANSYSTALDPKSWL